MGGLIATWLGQLRAAPLVLLGRSGRVGADPALTLHSFGTAMVTLARCNVASAEEVDGILSCVAASCREPLQVMHTCFHLTLEHGTPQWLQTFRVPCMCKPINFTVASPCALLQWPYVSALSQGILHAGAVLDSGVIANIGASAVRTEFAAKVHGAHVLIRRSGHDPLRVLNLFSSLAAFSGSGGQGSYAAANAVLDSWAQSLQARDTLKS